MKSILIAGALLLATAAPAAAMPLSSIVVAADACTLLRHGHGLKDAVATAIKANASSYIPDYRKYGKALSSFTSEQLLLQCPEQLRRVYKEVQI